MSLERCVMLTQGPVCEMSSDFIALLFFSETSQCLFSSQRPLQPLKDHSVVPSLSQPIWGCSPYDALHMTELPIFFTQTNKSTFIIQCDKLTWKMSAIFYTYMNFCVRSLSACLFCFCSIAEGFKVHMRVHFLSTPSDRSPFALVNLVINFGRFP